MPSAAILAGGRAVRFGGRDKSALVVDGRPILSRQLEALADIDDVLFVGRDTHVHQSDDVRVRYVVDRVPGCGPLGGLDAALTQARHSPVVVLACDMPNVTQPLLRHLLALSAEADAVVPHTEDGYHPLCAVYGRACHPAIVRRLAEGRLALRGLLDDLKVRVVSSQELAPFGDPRWLMANVNTPTALQGLEAPRIHEP